MGDSLSKVDLDVVDYVAGLRLAEAHGIRMLAGAGPLSGPAQAYLDSVKALFEALRGTDAKARREALLVAGVAQDLHGR